MMSDPSFLWRFTPNRTNPDTLRAIFVQRHALVEDTVQRIRESVLTGNKHQLLFVGPRGIGKTHLVTLAQNEVAGDPQLHDRLRIAWLHEDETTTSLLDLLLRILRALSATYPAEFPAEALEPLYALDVDDARRTAIKLLLERSAGRTLLVIVENLDALFGGLGEDGQKQWRAFLQENPITSILATAQQLFDGVSRRTSPFFGFFQVEHLQPLSLCEAVELLTKIARNAGDDVLASYLQTPEGRSRVRALHHLSGGNHRVYIVLSQLIDRQSLDELIGPFEKMLDELTPYYQERLRWLSPQQRKIVEFLCICRSPVPVKEIAKRLFITDQTAASQLKQLRENGYVVSHTRGRESLYELTEPLMRLSFEVKQTGRKPMRLIVDFLRTWYRPEELRTRLATLSEGAFREREHICAALESSAGNDPRIAVILADIQKAKEAGRLDEAIVAMEELAHIRSTKNDWLDLGCCLDEAKRFEEALAGYDRALEIDRDFVAAWNNRGGALSKLARFREALANYERALEIDPKHAVVWYNRGIVLSDLGQPEKALASYDRALEIDPKYARVWNDRGAVLGDLGRFEEALASYGRAIEIDRDFAAAWNNRGIVLSNLGQPEEALASYDRALEIAPRDARVWNNRGSALGSLCKFEKALASYDKSLAITPDFRVAAFNRAELLLALERWEEGFGWLEKCCTRTWPPQNQERWADIASMIGLVLLSTLEPAVWRKRVERLVRIWGQARKLTLVGEELVRSLGKIDATMLSREALDTWRRIWLEVGKDLPELEIGLRLFDVGMRYLMEGDRRVLLDLLASERPLVEEALGLSPEE